MKSLEAYLKAATEAAPERARSAVVGAGSRLVENASANLALMQQKLRLPAEPLELRMLTADIENLSDAVDAANKLVDDFNRRISDRKLERRAIDAAFWQIMRRDRAIAFAEYEGAMAPLQQALASCNPENAMSAPGFEPLMPVLQSCASGKAASMRQSSA